jgi:hypothetical protein
MASLMEFVFMLMVHCCVAIAVCFQLRRTAHLVVNAGDDSERMVRFIAAVTGFILVFVGKGIGISLPEIAHVLGFNGPLLNVAATVLLPGAAGVFLAWFIGRVRHDAEGSTVPWLILVSTLMLTEFTNVYVAVLGSGGFADLPALTPNLVFLSAIGLYVVKTHRSPLRTLGATVREGTSPVPGVFASISRLAKALWHPAHPA